MSIPGYGAEASVYRSSVQYRAALAAGVTQWDGAAVPQQAESLLAPIPPDPCARVCALHTCDAARACCRCNGGVATGFEKWEDGGGVAPRLSYAAMVTSKRAANSEAPSFRSTLRTP
jgi:hypothetical protein